MYGSSNVTNIRNIELTRSTKVSHRFPLLNQFFKLILRSAHCVKSVRIPSYSGRHFPAFGLNTEGYGVSIRIQFKCGKIRTRMTPNTDTFYAVQVATPGSAKSSAKMIIMCEK